MSSSMQIFSGPLDLISIFFFMEKLFLRYTFNCIFLLPTLSKQKISKINNKYGFSFTNTDD